MFLLNEYGTMMTSALHNLHTYFTFFEKNLKLLVISNMKDPKIPSFRATGHSTYKLELNVHLSIIAFKLMTSSLLDPWRVFPFFDKI